MRLNILLLTADDMDAHTPGSFGGPQDATPTLDRLAREGMAFRRAYVAAAVCQPSRSAIMTGLWPHRNGAEGFEPITTDSPLITEILKDAGYLAGILGKVEHLQPIERFGWDLARGMHDLGMGRDPQAYEKEAASFFKRAASQDRPWFLMANAHDPHRPFHGSLEEQVKFSDAEQATYPAPSKAFGPTDEPVPGFLPALPAVQEEYAQYLASSRRADDVFAGVLRALEEAGQKDQTLILFLSDNGMAFPFAKANCYLRSTLTPLIIRWPGVTVPGSVNERSFVSALDLFPTFCQAAGVPVPEDVDGRPLLELLAGGRQDGRGWNVSVFHETAAKRRYEMRCAQNESYGYIWNGWANGQTEYKAENMAGQSWSAIVDASEADTDLAARVEHYVKRPAEELYNLRDDSNCLTNLAHDPGHRHGFLQARAHLLDWMEQVSDPLLTQFQAVAAEPAGRC
jgi:N-sulfoglucosamine sulfohydrolase